MSSLQILEDIPEDIVRLVLETAAEDDRQTCLSLVLVSKTLQRWIDPILYRYVCIRDPDRCSIFHNTINANTKLPNFFALNVRHLCIGPLGDDIIALNIIVACTGISTLAVWTTINLGSLASSAKFPNLRRLSCSVDSLSVTKPNPEPNPFFSSLTHLEIVSDDLNWSQNIFSVLYFTNLTQLSLDCSAGDIDSLDPFIPCFTEFINEIPPPVNGNLKLIIFFKPDEYVYPSRLVLHESDERVVFGTVSETESVDEDVREYVMRRPFKAMLKDWGYCPPDEPDMWEIAEGIRNKRETLRNGHVE